MFKVVHSLLNNVPKIDTVIPKDSVGVSIIKGILIVNIIIITLQIYKLIEFSFFKDDIIKLILNVQIILIYQIAVYGLIWIVFLSFHNDYKTYEKEFNKLFIDCLLNMIVLYICILDNFSIKSFFESILSANNIISITLIILYFQICIFIKSKKVFTA